MITLHTSLSMHCGTFPPDCLPCTDGRQHYATAPNFNREDCSVAQLRLFKVISFRDHHGRQSSLHVFPNTDDIVLRTNGNPIVALNILLYVVLALSGSSAITTGILHPKSATMFIVAR